MGGGRANFLIDAESNLKAALSGMSAKPTVRRHQPGSRTPMLMTGTPDRMLRLRPATPRRMATATMPHRRRPMPARTDMAATPATVMPALTTATTATAQRLVMPCPPTMAPATRTEGTDLLGRIIEWSVRNVFLVLLATVFIVAAGVYAVVKTPLDALPDLSDVQVIVYTEYPGQAPQVVEDQVTYPLTTAMLSVPDSKVVRGFSFFGVSFVYVIFEDGTDIYWARTRVLEYLNFAARLPPGVSRRSARTRPGSAGSISTR